jgi:hypothetical protein
MVPKRLLLTLAVTTLAHGAVIGVFSPISGTSGIPIYLSASGRCRNSADRRSRNIGSSPFAIAASSSDSVVRPSISRQTRRGGDRDRKCIRAGSGAPPDASRRCPAVGHDPFAGLFPADGRGSARDACQPGIFPARAPQARTNRPRFGRPPCAPLARMMEHQRTPSAWIILPARFTPTRTRLRRG